MQRPFPAWASCFCSTWSPRSTLWKWTGHPHLTESPSIPLCIPERKRQNKSTCSRSSCLNRPTEIWHPPPRCSYNCFLNVPPFDHSLPRNKERWRTTVPFFFLNKNKKSAPLTLLKRGWGCTWSVSLFQKRTKRTHRAHSQNWFFNMPPCLRTGDDGNVPPRH